MTNHNIYTVVYLKNPPLKIQIRALLVLCNNRRNPEYLIICEYLIIFINNLLPIIVDLTCFCSLGKFNWNSIDSWHSILKYNSNSCSFDQKSKPADSLKKYKMKHIPKNVIMKTQDMIQNKTGDYNETVIFQSHHQTEW